jgi:hypothetical protein
VLFTIAAPRITESSSLAVSTTYPGLIYTTNDSGDGANVYVLDRSGALVGTTTLAGVDAVDIEAISAGADGSLVVGDIGDNDVERSSVQVYRIPQPGLGDHTVRPATVSLTYADGPRNAESLVYDAATGRVVIVSKELFGHVYRTPPNVFSRSTATLTKVANGPMVATDATLLDGGRAVAVRTYHDAVIYHYPSFAFWTNLDLPRQQQGESIAAVPGRGVVYVGSEGVRSAVWSVPLPPLDAAGGAGAGGSGAGGSDAGGNGGGSTAPHPAAREASTVRLTQSDGGWSATTIGVTTVVVIVAAGAAVVLLRQRRST